MEVGGLYVRTHIADRGQGLTVEIASTCSLATNYCKKIRFWNSGGGSWQCQSQKSGLRSVNLL